MARSDALEDYLQGFRTWLQDAGFERKPGPKEVWQGNVFVDWSDPVNGDFNSASHAISISLPSAFPFHAPIVVCDDDPPLSPSWHLVAGSVSALCLWDSRTGWRPHFTAQRLLQRIQEWFLNYHTGNWPPDSEAPDLHTYLEKIGIVVIGDDWTPPDNSKSGRFTFWRYESFGRLLPCLASCYPDGHVELRIEETESRLVENLIVIRDDIQRSAGVWFRLANPFVPPDDLEDLLIGIEADLQMETGWAVEKCIHAVGRKVAADGFPLALGYSDYRGEERWLFLWAHLSSPGSNRKRIPLTSSSNLARMTLSSFQTAPARRSDLLRRSAHVSKHLTSRRVIVFGVGALGSSVALLLAKAGVGEIRLVDDDVLLPGNVARHTCGLKWIGFDKTYAMKKVILEHNPDCEVSCFDSTWGLEELRGYFNGCDVVIDTTANRNFSLYLNQICVESDQPTILAAAYRRAAVGRILIHRGDQDPCLACYSDANKFWSEDQYPTIPLDPDEAFIEDGCGVVTEEAVALDVEAVANLTTRIAIRLMRGQLDGKNIAILVNEPLAGASGILGQEGIHWWTNNPLPACRICCEEDPDLL